MGSEMCIRDRIMKAQMARGADFESGNLIKRAKAMVPLLVPLFVSAFRRAGELAMAMEARCYHGGEGRPRLRVLHFQKIDWQASLVTVAALLVTILGRRWNLLCPSCRPSSRAAARRESAGCC